MRGRSQAAPARFLVLPLLLAAACAAPLRLERGPGERDYRLEIVEGAPEKRLTVDFRVSTDAAGREEVRLLRATRGSEPVALDWRGPFPLRGWDRPDEIVPAGVPEDLFGAVMDVVTFLLVQTDEFGARGLRAAGDRVAFGPFSTGWSRPPAVLDARVAAAGGELVLAEVAGGRARVEWRPRPFDVSIVRPNMLLAGTETLVLELEIDTRDGGLVAGRSTVDRLALRAFAPYASEEAPPRERWPATGGFPVEIERRLSLTRAPGP